MLHCSSKKTHHRNSYIALITIAIGFSFVFKFLAELIHLLQPSLNPLENGTSPFNPGLLSKSTKCKIFSFLLKAVWENKSWVIRTCLDTLVCNRCRLDSKSLPWKIRSICIF